MSLLPRNVNEFIALMAPCPSAHRGQDDRRWALLYQIAAWCLWKAYLLVSFGLYHYYWNPEAALGYYREMIRTRILSDRVLLRHERYRNGP